MKNKPSDFTKDPMDSVLQKVEVEIVARNIMVILNRTGNTFRKLSWDEYKAERLKDGNFSFLEETYFNEVIDYCVSPDTAILFSKNW